MRLRRIWETAILIIMISSAAGAHALDGGRLGTVMVYAPLESAKGVVILLSDPLSNPRALSAAAHAIAQARYKAAVVDSAKYLSGLDAEKEACHRASGDFRYLSERLSAGGPSSSKHPPVIAGSGSGGALAYAVLAQSNPGEFAGAVAFDFNPALPGGAPLCPGAPVAPYPGGFRYLPKTNLPGFFRIATSSPDNPVFAAFEKAQPGVLFPLRPYDDTASAVIAILSAESVQPPNSGPRLDDLPLVPLAAKHHGKTMAIIYSGDGGWRDLDKQIGEALQKEGIPVVGVDTLRYFWRKKTPEEAAQGLSLIINHFTRLWDTPDVLLVGYSFGADIIPFAFNRLPAAQQSCVRQITLLGVSRAADFEIHMSQWIGDAPSADALPMPPELKRLEPTRVQCIYGEEDQQNSGCTDAALRTAEVVRTGGGHHFDGDYQALAKRIIDGAAARGARISPDGNPQP